MSQMKLDETGDFLLISTQSFRHRILEWKMLGTKKIVMHINYPIKISYLFVTKKKPRTKFRVHSIMNGIPFFLNSRLFCSNIQKFKNSDTDTCILKPEMILVLAKN